MSFQAMAWAVDQKLPATKKIVLLMLANRVNSDTGKCVPKIKTLADDCGLSESATKAAIKELADAGLVSVIPRFYEGQQLPNQYWLNPEGGGQEAPPPRQNVAGVGREKATESGIESGKEPKQPFTKADYSALFDMFWKTYPKKVAKDAAYKAFAKRKPDDKMLKDILQAVELQKTQDQWQRDGGKFIPHPATWLNEGRWMDEVEGVSGGSSIFVGAI